MSITVIVVDEEPSTMIMQQISKSHEKFSKMINRTLHVQIEEGKRYSMLFTVALESAEPQSGCH